MSAKRKHSGIATSSKKRLKTKDPSQVNLEDSDVYEVDQILKENKTRYLISWAPNRITGEEYDPTWEPKKQVNQAAIDEWEEKKTALGGHVASKSPVEQRGRGRPRKGIAVVKKAVKGLTEKSSPQVSSPPTASRPATRKLRRVPDSSPSLGSQLPRSSAGRSRRSAQTQSEEEAEEEVEESLQGSQARLQSETQDTTRDPASQITEARSGPSVRVIPSPLRPSQQAEYDIHSSPGFPSSQILVGTAPDREEEPDSIDSPQVQDIDAAAAPDLTQKHSQYQVPDTSGSAEDTTGSAEVTTSTGSQQNTQSGASRPRVIPDTLDQAASQTYEPPTQNGSKSTEVSSGLTNGLLEEADDISDDAGTSRPTRTQQKGRSGRLTALQTVNGTSASRSPRSSLRRSTQKSSSAQENKSGDRAPISRVESAPAALTIGSVPQSSEASSIHFLSQGAAPTHISITSSAQTAPRGTLEEFETSQITPPRPSAARTRSRSANITPFVVPSLTALTQQISDSSALLSSQIPLQRSRSQRQTLGSPFSTSKEVSRSTNQKSSNTLSHFKTQISLDRQPQNRARAPVEGPNFQAALESIRQARQNQPASSRDTGRVSKSQKPSVLDVSSSSIRQPPSQWPETFAFAPPRPDTPSPVTPSQQSFSANKMPSTSPQSAAPSHASLKIQELKEAGGPITPAQRSMGMTTRSSASRAGSPAIGGRDARSPSAVPHAEHVPIPSDEDMRTSERYLTLIPDKPGDAKRKKKALPGGITDESVQNSPDKALQPPLQEITEETMEIDERASITNEFVVPVFFMGHQRDTYKQTVVWKRKFIEDFLAQTWPEDSPKLTEARALIERLNQVTFHPDLMNEESFTQAQTSPKDKAAWDKDSSTKFRLIYFLLSQLEGQDKHIVIDVEAGRLLDILDTFLTGLGIRHFRAGEGVFDDASGLRVTLLPKHQPSASVAKADLVIGFEGALELIEDQRIVLRTHTDGHVAPLLYLVVPKTVEHIERLTRAEPYTSMSATRRITMLVENSAALRNEAGYRQIHDQDAKNTAASIVKFLLDGGKPDDWPIDDLPDVVIKDPASESQATTASESTSGVAASTATKRSLDTDDDVAQMGSKKVRLAPPSSEPPSTINPASLTLSAVSDSLERRHVSTSEYVSDMTALRVAYEEREARLTLERDSLQIRLDEHITALEGLQYRHEDQRAELIKARVEKDEALAETVATRARGEAREGVLIKVKADREELKAQLAEAKAALASHAVPEVAEMTVLKASLAEAEKKEAKFEKRVEGLKSEVEYIRALYQDASSKATVLAEENGELSKNTAELESRASERTVQALAASKEAAHVQLRARIKKLEIMNADRERMLKVKDDEMARLKEKDRGRMGTRGGSVPRSPGRLGSPMRLEPPRSSGAGSRAGSPRRGSPAAGQLGVVGEKGRSRLGR